MLDLGIIGGWGWVWRLGGRAGRTGEFGWADGAYGWREEVGQALFGWWSPGRSGEIGGDSGV